MKLKAISVLLIVMILPFLCGAEQSLSKNDIYATMRTMLNPRITQQISDLDSSAATTNLNLILDWIVHVSQPGITNETTYFNSYKQPISVSTLNFDLLTNRAARLSYIPPMVKLSLVFDDKARDAVTRAIPGVDYPGVSYEDEGTTPHDVRLVLRAPKFRRRFRFRVEGYPSFGRAYEFQWIALAGRPGVSCWAKQAVVSDAQMQDIFVVDSGQKGRSVLVAVFAREKGGPWGPPSFIHVDPDSSCSHVYEKHEIFSIDYGDFKDVYNKDEKGRIVGFTRIDAHTFERKDFANAAQLIVETYPNGSPKIARKVSYFVEGKNLRYKIFDNDETYKMEPLKVWQCNW